MQGPASIISRNLRPQPLEYRWLNLWQMTTGRWVGARSDCRHSGHHERRACAGRTSSTSSRWRCGSRLPAKLRSWSILRDPSPIASTFSSSTRHLIMARRPRRCWATQASGADIEAKIDTIWAQAGVDINFLPNVVRYNNTFAYQGSGGTRSAGDLNVILDSAANSGGILNPDPSVIDMFFVNVVPGWPPKGANWVNGLSNTGTNGIAEYVGSSVLATDHGRELAAHWIAHEIGHNLGLYHSAPGSQNLMNGDTRTTDQLTSDQVDAVFGWQFRNDGVAFIPQNGTRFPKLIPEPAPGDYSRDGAVTAADYTVWRDTLGSNTFLAADGNGDGSIDAGDYATWKANLGKSIQPPALVGDFNHNGVVDAADFTVWRDTLGKTVAFGTGADANRNSLVDDSDYAMWKANFGKSTLPPGLTGDYNHNGIVDAADYSVWRDSLGSTTNLAADGNGNGTIDAGGLRRVEIELRPHTRDCRTHRRLQPQRHRRRGRLYRVARNARVDDKSGRRRKRQPRRSTPATITSGSQTSDSMPVAARVRPRAQPLSPSRRPGCCSSWPPRACVCGDAGPHRTCFRKLDRLKLSTIPFQRSDQ